MRLADLYVRTAVLASLALAACACQTAQKPVSLLPPAKAPGLSVFGLAMVKRIEEVGMGVDVSHCGDQTTLDALEAATKPVIFTHATCRALIPAHLRAKTGEAIRKMAKTGGVMGVSFIRFMVRDREPVTIEHVLDQFDL